VAVRGVTNGLAAARRAAARLVGARPLGAGLLGARLVGGRLTALTVGLAVALPLVGCAGLIGSYDMAPNGLARDEDGFRRAVAFEAEKAYSAAVNGARALPDDDLLRLLYAGIAGRYAGAYTESSRLLDVASYVAEDRVTLSLSREALSMITSDRALAYVPTPTERLMIPYFAALNYLDDGDYQGAAVEARRIEAQLDQLHDGVAYADRPQDARFLHYFAGAIFDAAGDWNAADVAYRRAGAVTESLGRPWEGGRVGEREAGEVIVLVERGFVPHRVEQSVVVVLPPAQARLLTEGSLGDKALAAAEAAARILITASLYYGDRSGYYHDPGYRSPVHLEPWRGDRCHDGVWARDGGRCANDESEGSPYLLRMSWPVLYQDPVPPAPVRIRAGELGADAMARFDVGASVRSDFQAQRTTMLARTVARSASKLALTTAVEHSVAKRDEAAGQVAGFLTNLGTLVTERADTRGWHLMPGSISMVRLRLPAGTHDLSMETASTDGGGRAAPLATVTVRPGETTFVSTRLWR
jgi:uncharacterized protein